MRSNSFKKPQFKSQQTFAIRFFPVLFKISIDSFQSFIRRLDLSWETGRVMPDSQLSYRVAVAILFSLWALIRIGVRIRNRHEHTHHAWLAEPLHLVQARWLVFLIFVGLAISYPLYPDWVAAADFPLPAVARWCGLGLSLLGLGLLSWVHLSPGRVWSPDAQIQDGQRVARGPYRHVRHPMYGAAMLFFGGVSLLAANLLILLPSAATLLLLLSRISQEERMLIRQFGAPYQDYCSQTGLFIPALFGPRRK
jgi:protein-S-isoprenylcysteine O-methyltransferase Ste14